MSKPAADTIIAISPAEFRKIPLFKSLSYETMEDVVFKSALLRIEEGSVVITPGQSNQRIRPHSGRHEHSLGRCRQRTRGDVRAR